ncbi:MAG: ABC transporter ATP-binding protein, partial [Ruminiclostridium sp.]|nr:ABC transporter ATP-binding protein [Ruminiclostridium sp.]
MLECTNLTKSYKKKCVVNSLSFNVKRGEIFAFLGSNGAGKTTTIKMILGLVGIDSGEVKIAENIRIGYSPETPYFPPFLTGYEVLEYYAGIQKIAKTERKAEIPKLLETVGLENDKTRVKNYSKGMLQRLALAQALLGNPDLLILDEPTAGLDALGRLEIMQLIEKLKNSGKTIIINSH